MPQPLSGKLKSNPHLQFYLTGGFEKRQKIAVSYARAMDEFGVCEDQLAVVYLILNKDRPDAAYIELQSNITYSSRIKLVKNDLSSLSIEDQALGYATLHRAESAAKMRNKIAHCTWGFSEQLPDCVLRVNNTQKDIRERLKKLLGIPFQREAAEVGIFCYTADDFDKIRLAALDAAAPLTILCDYLMGRIEAKEAILSDPSTKFQYNKCLLELTAGENS